MQQRIWTGQKENGMEARRRERRGRRCCTRPPRSAHRTPLTAWRRTIRTISRKTG